VRSNARNRAVIKYRQSRAPARTWGCFGMGGIGRTSYRAAHGRANKIMAWMSSAPQGACGTLGDDAFVTPQGKWWGYGAAMVSLTTAAAD